MKEYSIIRNTADGVFDGCDFVVKLDGKRKNTEIRILQITDTQVIDASQRRTPDRIRADEISAWDPKNFDSQCGDHIRSLVAATRPDLIIITGDIVYGSFDDEGTTLKWFIALMDSLMIPWAPIFGNHDNESNMGVKWQCDQLMKSYYCLFKRGDVTGNGNYSVGIAVGDELIRVIHMTDSNGCTSSSDPSVEKVPGIYDDQLELIRSNSSRIARAQGRCVPAFMAFHIPVDCFATAEEEKDYKKEGRENYIIGVDVPSVDGDFGFKLENYRTIKAGKPFITFLRSARIDGVFVGHVHNDCTCINYENIKWVFRLKTGQYDYHIPGQLGGTLITAVADEFSVMHVPALVRYAPMPRRARMFDGFFTEAD